MERINTNRRRLGVVSTLITFIYLFVIPTKSL